VVPTRVWSLESSSEEKVKEARYRLSIVPGGRGDEELGDAELEVESLVLARSIRWGRGRRGRGGHH
jgi:hypothetical protein